MQQISDHLAKSLLVAEHREWTLNLQYNFTLRCKHLGVADAVGDDEGKVDGDHLERASLVEAGEEE